MARAESWGVVAGSDSNLATNLLADINLAFIVYLRTRHLYLCS